jgi:hypothetical protein
MAGSAGANSIYTNVADTAGVTTLAVESESFSTWASQFLTPSGSALTLNDVIANLEQGNTTTGTVTAELWSDSSNTPGTLLATIEGVTDASIPNTFGAVTFTASSTIILQPSTEYWIVLNGSSTGQSDALWEPASDETGMGIIGQNHAEGSTAFWSTFSNDSFTNTIPEMEVDATVGASGVPEPATFGLMGIALAAVAVARSRRQAKA